MKKILETYGKDYVLFQQENKYYVEHLPSGEIVRNNVRRGAELAIRKHRNTGEWPAIVEKVTV